MKKKYWISDHVGLKADQRAVLNDYLFSVRLANLSARTIDGYRQTLEKFLEDNPLSLKDLKHKDVWDWVLTKYSLRTIATRNNVLTALSMFFKYCKEEGSMNQVLIKRYWRGRRPKAIPKFLTKPELAQVRLALEQSPLRDRAIVEFFLSSGCRLSELTHLDVSDVDLNHRTAQVTGKGQKTRFVHFSELCGILLNKYLVTHNYDDPALFLTYDGRRLGNQSVQQMANKLGESAGLRRRLTPHCFRHTFATHFLAKGADINLISDLLGHEDLNTTRIYANHLPDRLMSLYRRHMG